MPRPRFHKLAPEKRRAILDAAGQEFAAHGFEQASLNAIIASVGVSKGAFYYYFDDKADLFATVLEELYAEYNWAAALDASGLGPADFWSRLEELTLQTFADARDRPWLMDVGKAFYDIPPELRAAGRIYELLEGIEAATLGFIRHGQEIGAVRTDLPASLLLAIFFALDQAFSQWMPENLPAMGDEERVAFLSASFDLVRRIADPR